VKLRRLTSAALTSDPTVRAMSNGCYVILPKEPRILVLAEFFFRSVFYLAGMVTVVTKVILGIPRDPLV
jgi:hypothetical protein